MPTIEDVRNFWNDHPLFSGDIQAKAPEGSLEFFKQHTLSVLTESGGSMDARLYPVCRANDPVLDLGCGIGFWIEQFGQRGFTNITGADLSERSLDLSAKRCAYQAIAAQFTVQNAEAMTFQNETFAHVQSLGVIHHSPHPDRSIAEIYRVLKPRGRAVVSVYYKNFPLRHWRLIRPLGAIASRLKLSPRGRGRDDMMRAADNADELVRLYDGVNNPIGMAFTRDDMRRMFAQFRLVDLFTYTFPARLLPFRLPRPLFKFLQFACPFMICAVAEKR